MLLISYRNDDRSLSCETSIKENLVNATDCIKRSVISW